MYLILTGQVKMTRESQHGSDRRQQEVVTLSDPGRLSLASTGSVSLCDPHPHWQWARSAFWRSIWRTLAI